MGDPAKHSILGKSLRAPPTVRGCLGLVFAGIGFLVSAYAFVEIEVFSPGRLVYHLLGHVWTAPAGMAGTAAWPWMTCWISGPPGYGIPGARCLFPNYDEMVLFAALAMSIGLFLWFAERLRVAGPSRRQRLVRALILTLRVMATYSGAVFVWCIVLFGALPTWDQSVVWAASSTWSYPAATWDPITNTCLAPFPGHTNLWPSCYFPNFLECLVVALLAGAVSSSVIARWERESRAPIDFTDYTVGRYEEAVAGLGRDRWLYVALVLGFALGSQLIYWQRAPATSASGARLQWLTLVWLLPLPLVVARLSALLVWYRPRRFSIIGKSYPRRGEERTTVVFQITSSGKNPATVEHTVRSVHHWTQACSDVGYRTEIWLCLDEGGPHLSSERVSALRGCGVRIIWTPRDYRTPRGTTGKGRALQYAMEERGRRFEDLARVFVYYQDDETAVGEDTVRGLDLFIDEHGNSPSVGAGLILYPQRAEDLRSSQLAEFVRSHDDLRLLMGVTTERNLAGGYHGSHVVVRADVENSVGFDIGPDQVAEDLVFEARIRAQYGGIFHILRGFAYELAPLSVTDQFRQRRRWIHGWRGALGGVRLGTARRLSMLYQLLSWGSALVSLAVVVASLFFGFPALFEYSGLLAGTVWASLLVGLLSGHHLNRGHMRSPAVAGWRIVTNAVVAFAVEAVAPWYAFMTAQPSGFQVIEKDRAAAGLPRSPPNLIEDSHGQTSQRAESTTAPAE